MTHIPNRTVIREQALRDFHFLLMATNALFAVYSLRNYRMPESLRRADAYATGEPLLDITLPHFSVRHQPSYQEVRGRDMLMFADNTRLDMSHYLRTVMHTHMLVRPLFQIYAFKAVEAIRNSGGLDPETGLPMGYVVTNPETGEQMGYVPLFDPESGELEDYWFIDPETGARIDNILMDPETGREVGGVITIPDTGEQVGNIHIHPETGAISVNALARDMMSELQLSSERYAYHTLHETGRYSGRDQPYPFERLERTSQDMLLSLQDDDLRVLAGYLNACADGVYRLITENPEIQSLFQQSYAQIRLMGNARRTLERDTLFIQSGEAIPMFLEQLGIAMPTAIQPETMSPDEAGLMLRTISASIRRLYGVPDVGEGEIAPPKGLPPRSERAARPACAHMVQKETDRMQHAERYAGGPYPSHMAVDPRERPENVANNLDALAARLECHADWESAGFELGVDWTGGRSLTRYLQNIQPLEAAQELLGNAHIAAHYQSDAPAFMAELQQMLTGQIVMQHVAGDLEVIAADAVNLRSIIHMGA